MGLAKGLFPADRGCGCDRQFHEGGLSMKSYVTPSALLNAGSAQYQADATGRGGARDLSQPVYNPWRNFTDGGGSTSVVLPAEFLQALPKVKGSPLEVIPSDAEATATQLRVRVQRKRCTSPVLDGALRGRHDVVRDGRSPISRSRPCLPPRRAGARSAGRTPWRALRGRVERGYCASAAG